MSIELHPLTLREILELKCPAIFKTQRKIVTEMKVNHSHDWDPSECNANKVVNQTKKKEQNSATVPLTKES